MSQKRPTIGYLVCDIDGSYQYPIWRGVESAAKKNDINLINFVGGKLDYPTDLPRNVIYDLVNSDKLDGLVIMSASIGGEITLERLRSFINRYHNLPIISIGIGISDMANVHNMLVDNEAGLKQSISHLITDHGYRHIAFISGPEKNAESQQRFNVYKEILAKYDIPFDQRLVATGNFMSTTGYKAVQLFLDERQVELDAIVAANDGMALGAVEAIKDRGIHVPDEIAVVGFDDVSDAESLFPPLTTVRQPLYSQGYQAVETLLEIIEGKTIPGETRLPTEFVTRQSCGCFSQVTLQANTFYTSPAAKDQSVTAVQSPTQILVELRQQKERILAEMEKAVDSQAMSLASGWSTKLFEAILTDLFAKPGEFSEKGAFISTLEEILVQINQLGDNVVNWQNLISKLRQLIMPFLPIPEISFHAENLWGQARVIIGEVFRRMQSKQLVDTGRRARRLRDVGAQLMANFDSDYLKDTLLNELPKLEITACYLSLCEDPQAPTDKIRVFTAYNEQGRIEFEPADAVIPAKQLVLDGMLPTDKRFNLMVLPLHFENDHLGFVVLETSHQEGIVYDTLRVQISSSLKGALLVEQEEKRIYQLQTVGEVSNITSTILEQKELLQRVVDLTKERFGLYHAHIYMLNKSRDMLYLAAGAGEVGRRMMQESWNIPITAKQSLIAEVARSGRFVIVDDVHQRKGWLANSFLPETASEMAVPILSKGEVIGVLDVQSDEIGGLEESDANLLLSLANNVAVSLTNASLFEEIVLSKEEAEQAKEIAEQIGHEADIARQEAEAAKQMMEEQVWQTTGQSALSDKMRGEQDVPTLSSSVIQQLCQYLGAQIGAFYIAQENELHLTGSYAYSNQSGVQQFKFGEGMVGQAAVEKRPLLITNVPDNYITVKSGLGEIAPHHIMVLPILYDDKVKGVIELGTLYEYSERELEFLDAALNNIGITLNTAQARAQINELLSQTQQQAEELQAQGEELRVANEELEAQTESLRASETKLKEKQQELETTNVQLEEKAAALEESSVALREKQAVLDQQNRELKTAQEELESKAEELALASKYKSEFLANMSHELRTPLNSLLILAHMLTENKSGNLNEEELESINIIYNGGNDLLNLINDILDLSKVESGKMQFIFEPMSLRELANTMHTQFDHIAQQKELALNITLAEDLPVSIETDRQRVTQIIKNLLSNAFKFTAAGSVSLDICHPAPDTDLSRSDLNPAETIAISVADTGIGMTAEQKKIIFEAFQQADGSTSRQYGGTGLGLSISRELANKLGGYIKAESEPNKGSTFTLYLPINKPTDVGEKTAVTPPKTQPQRSTATGPLSKPQTSPLPTNGTANSARTSSKLMPMPADDREDLQNSDKVLLLIEDDPKFAKVIHNYAHDKGFKTLITGTGQAGLELASVHRPDAIILDLNLPDMTGWEILETIKNDPNTRHIPVHIMSVEDENLDAYRKGAMGYITKPVSKKALDQSFSKIKEFVDSDIKSLLLVEDDDTSRHSIKKLLENDMVEISEAALGKTAVDLMAGQHFDCMILDLSLPDMNGFEVLETLNQKGIAEKCPIIVYTGRDLTPEENMKLMQYADSVIVKGVKSPERLLDETALFLHQVVADMPEEKQRTIKQLYNQDELLKGKRILIVDDDMRNSFALSKLLSEKEIDVRIAQHGQKALELLEEETFDLVLMDIMMPIMDGYETTKRIRAQKKFNTLPILALTAKAMKGDREKCIDAGANDYLPKPVNVDRLFSMLRVWLYQ